MNKKISVVQVNKKKKRTEILHLFSKANIERKEKTSGSRALAPGRCFVMCLLYLVTWIFPNSQRGVTSQ